ncbi:LysR family transcriptional regulator [Mailhella massiliensis]|uniref:LysR family transcriptional regulator n=1 Tax=Mailhella massiliensis TaxID=1903261 RepID=UPI00097D1E80|nr:LysR family transcriptional regulator [Mailhella massiliensis]
MIEPFSGNFLQWLRGFYAVAEYGNMSQAAESLHLKQPAVSYLVQCLEAELGVQLFHRRNKSMELTDEGRILHEKAITMFDLVKEIRSEVGSGGKAEYKGEISLSTTHSVSANIIAGPLALFHQKYPRTRFTLQSGGESSFTLDLVNSSAIDFGILAGREFPPTIEARPLFLSRLVLVCPRGSGFTRDENGVLCDPRELDGVPFVAFSSASTLSRVVTDELHKSGATPSVAATANNSAVILSYVRAGMGVTILEDFTVRRYQDTLDIYPLPGEGVLRQYSLITRRRRHLPPQSAACIDMLFRELSGSIVPL